MNTRHHYLSLLRTFALATLTAAAVTACTDDNGDPAGNEPITPADGIPVTFTANINPGSDADPAGAPDTRTVLTPTTEGGFTVTWKGRNDNPSDCDLINIWAVNAQGTAGSSYGYTYAPITSDVSSALTPVFEQSKITLPSADDWKFIAIYGHNSVDTNCRGIAYIPSLTQSAPGDTKHIAEKDFSVAITTKHLEAGDMPDIGLQFKHKLSALQLQIKNGTGEALTVREIRLSVTEGKITVYKCYSGITEEWISDGEQKSDYLQLKIQNPAALASDGTVQKFHMLLFPGYENKTLAITVITDRGEYTLTKTAPTSPGFEAGKNYLTDITIKSDGLQANETWTEIISTPEQLVAFREKVNGGNTYKGKTVRLTADIDLGNNSWTPIGSSSKYFRGTFDGGGYHISGLNVDNGTAGYAGLFGFVFGGTVRNLRVSGTVTTTGDYVGGIVGQLQISSTVENCIFSGTVNGRNTVGGIAGLNNSSRIAGCHTEGTVTATTGKAGGIAGSNRTSSSIDDCYSEAEVKASGEAGGIVGENQNSTVTHCYATGKVSGSMNVGGIAGYTNGGTFTGCIALNPGLTRTSGAAVTFGRFVGINYNNAATFPSCGAYDGMTIKDASNNDITGTTGVAGDNLTREQCLTKNTYTGFAEPTATKPGWAFDTATPWTYLPWNPAFETFSGISDTNYKISASTLTGGAN